MESINKYIQNFTSYLLLENINNSNAHNFISISLIENSIEITSNPFLSLMLNFYLKNNFNVIFISEREYLNHYSTISRKLGFNLIKSDNLIFVDLITGYNSILPTELPLSENFPSTFNLLSSKNYINCKDCFNKDNNSLEYDKILDLIEKKFLEIKKNNNNNKNILIMDKTMDEINLINKILKFSYKNDISTLFTMNKDLNEEKTIDYIKYLSDIIIEFKQNESGFSKDLDGIMNVNINLEKYNGDISEDKNASIRYKIKSNNIDFFTHLTI